MPTDPAPIHACGNPMSTSIFSPHSSTPEYRSQPIWICTHGCSAWQPREGWRGPLPAGWDGQAWVEDQT